MSNPWGKDPQDLGVPDDVLFYQRVEAQNTLSDRAVILGLTYYPLSGLWNPPWKVMLSGLPASALPPGFSGSGIPASVRDVNNSPFRAQDFLALGASMGVGVQQFRRLALSWFIYPFLAVSGGLRRDYQVVIGGSLSGGSWVGGEAYEIMQFADDTSELVTAVAYARKKSPIN